jgi:hypothetical protein
MVLTLDLNFIAGIVAGLTAIGTPVYLAFKKVFKILRTLDCNSEDIVTSKLERKVLLKGTLACLKGLQEQGCNGPVTNAISEIETYMLDQLHL